MDGPSYDRTSKKWSLVRHFLLSEVDFDIAYNRKVTKHCLKTNPDMHYEYKSKYIQKMYKNSLC